MAAVIKGSFEHVRQDPNGCCRWLVESGAISSATLVTFTNSSGLTGLEAQFDAPAELPTYPVEVARVSVFHDSSIVTVPIGDPDRIWLHRYPRWPLSLLVRCDPGEQLPWLNVLGGLCLWYPKDPPRLRWNWNLGIDTYLQMVQRHLWSEEYYRRHGHWPFEDAPHGDRTDGKPHPIATPLLRCA